MTDRLGAFASLALLLAALGCGGQSKSAFHESPGTGGSSGDGGSGGDGGSRNTGGSSGDGGSGAASSTGGASGGGGSGAGARAGSGATSGDGGTPSAGASGNPSGGAAGDGAAGAGGVALEGPLNGQWGMFWFEDPVAISIQQQGQALYGMGCCAGLPGLTGEIGCCGPLEGTSTDERASFAFPIEFASAVYGTDVYVSEDYQRMGGTFSVNGDGSRPVAWVRLPGGHGNLGTPPAALREALTQREGRFELTLSSAFLGRFEPLTPLELQISGFGFISGAFGPFYWGEMTWYAETEALTVGPVPATDPSFATSLELRFDGNALESVVVTYPDEPPYNFVVTRTRN